MVQQILKLSDAVATAGGTAIEFTMETTGGSARLIVPAIDLAFIIQFFAGAATFLDQEECPSKETVPIPLSGWEVQDGETPDSAVLVLNIGVPLSVEIPRPELARMGHRIALAANAPAAGSKLN